jgi:16S rRNA (guanine527-N7)-methyltransferase
MIQEQNRRLNLVGTSDPETLVLKHILDSLTGLAVLNERFLGKIIDIGTGAGLPGIPLAIAQAGLEITLVESNERKATFLQECKRSLDLSSVQVVRGRAEELGRLPFLRDGFEAVISRAVAPTRVLIEYTAPFCKENYYIVLYKGRDVDAEIAVSRHALEELRVQIEEIREAKMPYLEAERKLLVLRKVGPTPPRYPRRTGIPRKRPL